MVSVFIIGALTATILPDVPEYSKDTLKKADLTETYATTTPAQLINPGIEMEIQPPEKLEDLSILTVSSKPEQTSPDNPCGNNLGVKLIETGKVFCNLTIFELEESNLEGKSLIPHISLMFSSTDETVFELSIPIFVKPATYELLETQDQFKEWVVDNKVGTLSLLNLENIKNVGYRNPVKLDFEWLGQLLELGISQEMSDDDYSYYTRPIVVSKEVAQDIAIAIAHNH